MDVKDLRTESALSERNNDGSKYTQGGGALPCNRNKSYQDIGSNPLAKADAPTVRPCAVIGPDRVVPPPASSSDPFIKKVTIEPWLNPENVYRRPPEYPIKPTINQNPTRNISPRQTFQENMQRIMVPPNYSALKHGEDVNYSSVQDRSVTLSKNIKPNVAPEAKYCDVPYTINTLTNESKNIREAEMYVPSVNSPLSRTAPVWPPASVNVHAPRTFGAHDIYQYSQYQNCAGPRPTVIPVNRPPRVIQEEPGYPYPEHYYQDPNLRYKPYPPVKERYPQSRYEYISNYPPIGSFHPPSQIQPQKYDIPKPGQPHPYPVYPHLKYVENRIPDASLEGYPRSTNQQAHYNIPFRNQVIHPNYAPIPGNIPQNKLHPSYPPDVSAKVIHPNKLPYDSNNKMYIDYENSRTKPYPISDNYFVNEMSRLNSVKNQMIMPNYSRVGMPNPAQQYRKDNLQLRPYDYMAHYRNVEHPMNNSVMMRHPPQFSPSALAISPSDSIASNDTAQTHGTSQEDCGYVSQSSSASVRSIDSGMYKHNEFYKRYDYRYSPIVGSSPMLSNQKPVNSHNNKQKQIDVRQFLQMWNEGEDDNADTNNNKEIVVQTGSSDIKNTQKQHPPNQDQLYVLGLVNVPSEELSKYEHIQKISKLPENIKGYNSLELLSQFEEAIESSSTSGIKPVPREYQTLVKENIPNIQKQLIEALPRPVSPLDVEAKISQSVIHKEVGCNFEIRPCSPKMLNVEVATPAQNVLGERVIEKVSNPLSTKSKSPIPTKSDDNLKCSNLKRSEKPFAITDNPSCKMIGSPYESSNMDSVKTNYSLHDLEINSGVCLASLPQLDNEIELNFPEVNQQFINATKKDAESTAKTGLHNNLNEETNLSDTLNVVNKPDIVKGDTIAVSPESEKSFTKLIKYRKMKSEKTNHESYLEMNYPTRTDSVIIKNPENIKNIEDKFIEESNMNVPMNLSSQSQNEHIPNFESSKNSEIDNVALDFSLNKPSEPGLPIIDIERDESVTSKLPDGVVENVSHNMINDMPDESFTRQTINSPNHASKDNISDVVTEVDESTCIKSKQDVKKDERVGFEDDLINSPSEKNELTSMLNDVYSENVTSEKNLSENCQIGINCNSDTKDVTNRNDDLDEERTDGEQLCHSDQNVILDKSDNKNDIIRTNGDKIRDTLEKVLESSSKSADNLEDTVVNLYDGVASDINLDESQTIEYFKNKNLIETDEISATLEKIFEGTNDDLMSVNNNSNRSETPTSLPIRAVRSYKSKELHSPFMQKLLLYSDGICSSGENVSISGSSECTEELEEMGTFIAEDSGSQNMEVDGTNEITDVSLDKSNASVVVKVSETIISDNQIPSALLDVLDECNTATDEIPNNIDLSNTEPEEIKSKSATSFLKTNQFQEEMIDLAKFSPNYNDLSNIKPEEIQSKSATSLIKINQLQEEELAKSDLHMVENNDYVQQSQIVTDKLNLSSDKITNNGISDPDIHENKEEEVEFEKQSPDPINNDLIGTVSPSNEKDETSIQNKPLLLKHENNITEENCSLLNDDVAMKVSESGDKCKSKSEGLKTDDHIQNTEDTKSAETEEEKNDLELDNNITKKLHSSDLVCETDKNQEETTFETISFEKREDCNEHLEDEENLKENNISSAEISKCNELLEHETEDEIKKNQEDISQSDKMGEDTVVPSLNSDESVDYHVLIGEQVQTDDLAERTIKEDNDNVEDFSDKRKHSLKRSYSDSDLHRCRKINPSGKNIDRNITWPSKRPRTDEFECSEQSSIAGKLCSIIHNSRRNSVSTFYNEENVSFCILIDDNCIITEEGEDEKICFAEIDEDCITEIHTADEEDTEIHTADEEDHNVIESKHDEMHEEVVSDPQENGLHFSDPVLENYETEKSIEETWLDDVACVETVVSDDVAEEIVFTNSSSPKYIDTMYDFPEDSNCVVNENMDEIGLINEECIPENICEDEPYGISHVSYEDSNMSCDDFEPRKVLYKDECLERILSESNSRDMPSPALNDTDMQFLPEDTSPMIPEDKENIFVDNISLGNDENCIDDEPNSMIKDESNVNQGFNETENSQNINATDNIVRSCESSVDNVFTYKAKDDDINYTTSSSPEVSSTTSEEKSSSLVLKITNFNGSRVSQINENNHNRPRCKFTEKKDYSHSNGLPKRPLLTKGAQKYIPPLKESISDLKVKLSLPQQKLLKLKQLKLSKTEPKTNKINTYTIPKKPKPNFEDVLKNIDEVQIKMHKEKSKKTKPVPKVVIKKGHNGSHYTSSSNRDAFNPDLTGRKWQPWVFIEKNHFIDKMVIRNKTKAIFSHRQNTYVLAEKFKKYKSISSAKFVITHPNSGDSSKGQLKYTIRLKHTY